MGELLQARARFQNISSPGSLAIQPSVTIQTEDDIYQGHPRPPEINSSVQLHLHLQFDSTPPLRTSSVSSVLASLRVTGGKPPFARYKLSVGHRLTSKTDTFKSHIQSLRDPVDLKEECLQPCSTSAKLVLSTFLPVSVHKRPRTILPLCR